MIVDRVRTPNEDTSTFPGGLVALKFPSKQEPIQMFFLVDTSAQDPAEVNSVVRVNFQHNLESGDQCQLSISWSFD
jgi:hypothetical protein